MSGTFFQVMTEPVVCQSTEGGRLVILPAAVCEADSLHAFKRKLTHTSVYFMF